MLFCMIAYAACIFKQRSVTQIHIYPLKHPCAAIRERPGILAERFCFAERTKYLTALQQSGRDAIFISLIFLRKKAADIRS